MSMTKPLLYLRIVCYTLLLIALSLKPDHLAVVVTSAGTAGILYILFADDTLIFLSDIHSVVLVLCCKISRKIRRL